ncbi:MAG: V-type ATP synthase subunit D [Burkholderiaceae bacterium]|nr:V-type ATP synthase subunit D [Burkholderiaceae bacterium]
MAEFTPTRSLAIALQDERRTMREGYAFLDEKCLLLAGEMLREVRLWQQRQRLWRAAWRDARAALREAIARHGLSGLQTYPAAVLTLPVSRRPHALLGVQMQSAQIDTSAASAPPGAPAAQPSPEAQACRRAFVALLPLLVELAALSGVHAEYKRTVRRVRALQDVLLPEIEHTLLEIETSLEELEQDEAAVLRRVATTRA